MPLTFKFNSRRVALWASLLIVCGGTLSGCGVGATDPKTRGKELFATCQPCHGSDGSGNPSVGAPNIAGMSGWYVQEQLEKFRSGARGMHFNDVEGMRMRPMALSLTTDDDVKLVAQYVETMPPVGHARSMPGNAAAGAALYATCSSCHGDNGAGNLALKAPRIAGTDDWYLAAQIKKFKGGVRGANPKDREGRLMRPMAGMLTNDEAIRNVIAYVATLKP